MRRIAVLFPGRGPADLQTGLAAYPDCRADLMPKLKLKGVPGYCVQSFGCRASQADGEGLGASLGAAGLTPADPACADVVIVNTCSVTAEADKEARAFLRKTKRENPAVRLVVTGCYAQRAPEEVAALPGVDRVVGNSHKGLVAEIAAGLAGVEAAAGSSTASSIVSLEQLFGEGKILADDGFGHAEIASFDWASNAAGRHTRPSLKVQDGCGNRCSFCVIPQTRGGSRSVPAERVLEQVRGFAEAGGQEMVLSGINLGRWGRDLPGVSAGRFEELVGAVLRSTMLPRLRISSVEPMDWTDGLLALFRQYGDGDQPRLARHAHLPLQSGSDAILRRMHRRYRPWHYAAKVTELRAAMPEAAIGADVMVGFPGETDKLFEETFCFIAEQPFTYLHLFPFSARPGTPAWKLQQEHPVAGEAVRERMARLRELAAGKHQLFCDGFAGKTLSVVTLRSSAGQGEMGWTSVLSDNFLKARVQGDFAANRMLQVRVTGSTDQGLEAQVAGTAGRESSYLKKPLAMATASELTESMVY